MNPESRIRHLLDLASRATADPTGSAGLLRLVGRSLAEDAVTIRNQFVRNTVAGSVLVPRALRWLIYRLSGLQVDTPKVR